MPSRVLPKNASKPPLTTQTHLAHLSEPTPGFKAITAPVHKASTVIFESVAAMRAHDWRNDETYSYGLHGTPTTQQLQRQLAQLEGGQHCTLVPSGLAAISVVNLACLTSGDAVLLPYNVYGPTREMTEQLLGRFGVETILYDPVDLSTFELPAHAKLLWIEAAGSVTFEFPDLLGLIKRANTQQVLTVLDNTWGAGLAFKAFDLPEQLKVNIVVHALTKYPSGGADVLMGSIITQRQDLHLKIKAARAQLGLGVAANDVELILRSLPHMQLRYDAQDKSARLLADWLQNRPEIAQVLHPAHTDNAGYAHWRTVCGATQRAAGLFSIIFKPQYAQGQIDRFCEDLNLFKLGFSWGGPVSLVMPYDLTEMRNPMPSYLTTGCLVRLCIGLEDTHDLQNDLTQALRML